MAFLTVFGNRPRKRRAKRGRKNPPGSGNILSTEALEIVYIKRTDGVTYVHKFKPGVTIKRLPDGRALLYRPDGKPLLRFS